MPPGPFLTLDAVLLTPPGPAVVALLLVAGLYMLGVVTVRSLLRIERPDGLEQAAGFVLATALTAAVVHLLALLGLSSLLTLRVLGIAIVGSSLAALAAPQRAVLAAIVSSARATVRSLRPWYRLLFGICWLAMVSLLLASLAPPTDIDSLAYHLALPLSWLAHEGAYATPYWLHARLVGVGESLNMLGLAMGTDSFGSLLQGGGLLAAIVAACSVARTSNDRLFALVLVVACPIWSYMVLTGKPQLLPLAATTLALALLWRHARAPSPPPSWRELLLLFACLSFAAACKYSFLSSAGLLGIATAYVTLRRGGRESLAPLVATAAVAFVALVLPVWFRNVLFYGDPVSPILEKMRSTPEPAVVAFSWYLRNFAGEHSVHNLLRLPWNIVVPTGAGHFTTVLGVGALAVLMPLGRDRARLMVLALAAGAALIAALVGQLQARFFVEPYLWCALATVSAAWSWRKRLLLAALSLQLIACVTVALFALYILAPAGLSATAREASLRKHAADFAAWQWLNDVLSPDAVVATERRTILHAERRTLPNDYVQMTLLSSMSSAEKRRRIVAYLRSAGVTTLVTTEPPELDLYGWLAADAGEPVATSIPFADAVRNPWRQGPSYRLKVFDLRHHPLLAGGVTER